MIMIALIITIKSADADLHLVHSQAIPNTEPMLEGSFLDQLLGRRKAALEGVKKISTNSADPHLGRFLPNCGFVHIATRI